jgi:tellurite methyltransferase
MCWRAMPAGYSGMADWDARYREGFYDKAPGPHELLRRFQPEIEKGVVIDIAAGSGRDALFLAEKGYTAMGLEKSREAIEVAGRRFRASGQGASFVAGDAEALPFKEGRAAGVMVFYFLLRGIMPEIVDLLRKDGILIYETFLKRQNVIDRWRNPDYLLDDGELVSYFGALELLFYKETVMSRDGKQKAIAQYVGRKK